MAAALTFSTLLRDLGIDPTQDDHNASDLRQAIFAQGINRLDTLRHYNPDDMHTIFSTIRRPGGTVGRGANQHRNNGQNLTAGNELTLRKLVYACKYHWFTQRAFGLGDVTRAKLGSLWELKMSLDQPKVAPLLPNNVFG